LEKKEFNRKLRIASETMRFKENMKERKERIRRAEEEARVFFVGGA